MSHILFALLAPTALVVVAVVAVAAWHRLPGPTGRALVALMACAAGWVGTSMALLFAGNSAWVVWLTQATQVWTSATALAWLVFALFYADRMTAMARVALAVLSAEMVVFFGFLATNVRHGWVWSEISFVRDGPFQFVDATPGPLFVAHAILWWLVILDSFVLIVQRTRGAAPSVRRFSWLLIAGASIPAVLNVALILGLWGPERDFSAVGLALGAAAIGVGALRGQHLSIRPVARSVVVESLPEGMMVLDRQDRVIDANPAMRRLLGIEGSVIGQPIDQVLTPAQAEAVAAIYGEADGRVEATVEHGGSTRYYDVRISPLGERGDRLVLLQDVTRRRRQSQALREANEALQARNGELDAFAHTVAHDLKNSIQAVVGYAETLRDDDLPPDLAREFADVVVQSGRKMNSIVHELLLLAGVRQADVAPVPLAMGPLVREAIARVTPALEQTKAVVHIPRSWPVSVGHGPWVEEVWVNYIGNAAKYGGPAPVVTLGAEVRGDVVRYWVDDTGPGISPEAQESLFVPFSRVTTEAIEGHGLGLSIVRRITDKLGGACGVESEPGQGSRFWLELPAAPAAEPSAVLGTSAPAATSSAPA